MSRILKAVPLWLWLLLFTVVPLLMILFYAVVERTPDGWRLTGEYLKEAVTDTDYLRCIMLSLRHAAISTAVCLLLGYPLAYILAKMPERRRDLVSVLFLLPMWMNFLIRTYALMTLIDKTSVLGKIFLLLGIHDGTLIGTDAAVVIGMVYNFLPFLVLPIYTSMLKIDPRLIEASQDLGANMGITFRRIILPLTVPGVISGVTMVFVPSMTTFIIPQMLNNRTWTIGRLIEYSFKQEASANAVSGSGAALSFVLMILVIVCMSVVNMVDKDKEGGGLIA